VGLLGSTGAGAGVRATAFADGVLAVADRSKVRIVTPDGTVRQELLVAKDEIILTPPAIGPDGTLYLATQQAIYIVR
jgi:hypothetical protein